MAVYFITRHPGAQEWAKRRGLDALVVSHFDPHQVEAGDIVLGTLPVHLACQVCEAQAYYYHLTLDIPASERGQEMTADRMEALGAKFERFTVRRPQPPRQFGQRT